MQGTGLKLAVMLHRFQHRLPQYALLSRLAASASVPLRRLSFSRAVACFVPSVVRRLQPYPSWTGFPVIIPVVKRVTGCPGVGGGTGGHPNATTQCRTEGGDTITLQGRALHLCAGGIPAAVFSLIVGSLSLIVDGVVLFCIRQSVLHWLFGLHVIAGSNFLEPCSVLVNGETCELRRPIASTQMECTLPPGAGIEQGGGLSSGVCSRLRELIARWFSSD